jgi:hypothetical protein
MLIAAPFSILRLASFDQHWADKLPALPLALAAVVVCCNDGFRQHDATTLSHGAQHASGVAHNGVHRTAHSLWSLQSTWRGTFSLDADRRRRRSDRCNYVAGSSVSLPR